MPSNIVVLSGAGISAESGLQTFRDSGGLWEGHRVEDVATPEAFANNPGKVQYFYNLRRRQLQSPEVQCNAAHSALADFERRWPGEFCLVTQNVDDLHQRAGSRRVLPMHGELLRSRCSACAALATCTIDLDQHSRCESCNSIGTLRPHVVWFGEMPLYMDEIEQALAACDLFVSIGTSAAVYPAAGFTQIARSVGARTVELNLEPGHTAALFDESAYGAATNIVPQYFSGLLAQAPR
ncbi:MAG: NAD-dependent protein deacylase [Gammaproteobacteria bacterium]|nr:NAD-dependent protein deacylase [Gammaproteobacteria bacterium]NND39561.1 NAD-dependent protein deacylase [Pseudomonadales bacterium]NNM10803.1 NAD-dependent protein deacylase [Pseudomonadales bacterium]RZV58799.1 MAG: NAD-dependent protein deacylase [Pseudomonadales bacterium]